MKHDMLIRDSGKVRYCNANIARVGIIQYCWLYVTQWNRPAALLKRLNNAYLEALLGLLIWVALTLFFVAAPVSMPVLLMIKARRRIKDAKREVARERSRRDAKPPAA